MRSTILLVDDEIVLLETLTTLVKQAGYRVLTAEDGPSALALIERESVDLVVLDLLLPGLDGLEVCRRLRRSPKTATLPILILSAKASEGDKVIGLSVGADDYLTKPFSRRECLARIRALLRRAEFPRAQLPKQERVEERAVQKELRVGPLLIDLAGRQLFVHEKPVDVQARQFDLLVYLVRHRGTVLTRQHLLQVIWGYDTMEQSRTVDVHIRWLRARIEEDPSSPQMIQTVRGIGYVFRPDRTEQITR